LHLEFLTLYSVLFVCAANVCRSPMAEGLLHLLTAGEDDWRIGSAGVWALTGASASSLTIQLLSERQLDLSAHRARQVDQELLREYGVILVMEKNQREALRLAFPEFAGRIFLLSELVGEQFEIADPVGGGRAEFEATFHEIEDILKRGLPLLRKLARREEGGLAEDAPAHPDRPCSEAPAGEGLE